MPFGPMGMMGGQLIAPRPPGMARPSNQPPAACGKKRPRLTTEERLERSRERNRIHARKTRQRKKAMLSTLQDKVKRLHQHGTELRQTINDRKTASILLAMADPGMELPELPVPIEFDPEDVGSVAEGLSGKKRKRSNGESDGDVAQEAQNDEPNPHRSTKHPVKEEENENIPSDGGVKERKDCSIEELELLRRERNRMHAKRTRIRKKQLVDETNKMIQRLEAQNQQLMDYMKQLEKMTPGILPASKLAATSAFEESTEAHNSMGLSEENEVAGDDDDDGFDDEGSDDDDGSADDNGSDEE